MKHTYAIVLVTALSVIILSCASSPFESRSYDTITNSLDSFSKENFKGDITGLTLHYHKSNMDGTMPSEVYVHYSSNSRSESFKIYPWSEKKKEVYLIIADYDLDNFQVSAISGNFVHSDGELEEYATLKFDNNEFRYTIKGKEHAPIVPGHTPAYIFNFDLTDFNSMIRYLDPKTKNLDIGIIGLGNTGFVYSGKVRIERDLQNGTDDSLVFTMGGEAFNDRAGTMTIDGKNGYVTEYALPMPTTVPYKTFTFVLSDVSYMNETEWRALVVQKTAEILNH